MVKYFIDTCFDDYNYLFPENVESANDAFLHVGLRANNTAFAMELLTWHQANDYALYTLSDKKGLTPLMHTCKTGMVSALQLLISIHSKNVDYLLQIRLGLSIKNLLSPEERLSFFTVTIFLLFS